MSHLLSQGGREVAPERHFQCILDESECRNCGRCTRLASSKPQPPQKWNGERGELVGPVGKR